MKYFFFLLLLVFISSTIQAQDQMRVVGEAKLASGELIDNAVRDANGTKAGAIRIKTDLSGLAVQSNNGVIKVNTNPGEYFVFLSPDERVLTVMKTGYLPLRILLPEVGIRLKSGQVWDLVISGDKKLEQVPVNFILNPEDAILVIDGKTQKAPYTGLLLPVGKREISISKMGFATLTKTIEVSVKTNLFQFELKEVELQTLTLRSEPVGAAIFVDGIEKGVTNKGLFVYPGTYKVKLSLSGYVDSEQQIQVKENAQNEFLVKLEKNTGLLSWTLNPTNAQISINKEPQTGKTQAELAPGRYLIELAAQGFDSQSETIELKRGESLKKTWTLVQQTGGLQFSVNPVDAKITLKQNGQTVETWTGLKILRNLPVGTYELNAELAGYQNQTQQITISKDQTLSHELNLKKGNTTGESIKNSIGMEMVLIPSGTFQMGSNESDDEKPIHSVTISQSFYMGKYEVTQKEWSAIMGTDPSFFKGDNLPVEQVSWNDIQEFIKKLNQKEGGEKYRLPTEAEWEYAAKAGTNTKWHFGDNESQLGDYAWYSSNSNTKTHEVGQKKPNLFGLYDMHGNVWEWVQDWYGSNYYQSSPKTDPKGPSSGSRRVIRGGSWLYFAESARSASRNFGSPEYRYNNIGFRLLRPQ